jgi:hypothetical protein
MALLYSDGWVSTPASPKLEKLGVGGKFLQELASLEASDGKRITESRPVTNRSA